MLISRRRGISMKRSHLRQATYALALGVAIVPALAQSSGGSGSGGAGTGGTGTGGTAAAATCSTAPTSITALNIERTLTLTGNNSGIFTTMTGNLPPNLVSAITSGALEVREQITL